MKEKHKHMQNIALEKKVCFIIKIGIAQHYMSKIVSAY